jgi:hypothetical protein
MLFDTCDIFSLGRQILRRVVTMVPIDLSVHQAHDVSCNLHVSIVSLVTGTLLTTYFD